MRIKKSDSLRTKRRYVERHVKFEHDCRELGCDAIKNQERGCGKW